MCFIYFFIFLIYSFIFCIIISIYYLKSICYFFFKPLIFVTNINSFMYTSLEDIIYIYLILIFFFFFFFLLPLLIYFICNFLKNGLYLFEYKIVNYFGINLIYILFILLIIIYKYILPCICYMLFYYQIINKSDIFIYYLIIK